ncbi:hypothetical protein NKH60_30120 [Mesorhizobium sp. M1006]|uniref:hypothetical protein n=1 Tax=Mesorhizobium sp. M1006 TaxID=2957048 RepID=UPI003335082B
MRSISRRSVLAGMTAFSTMRSVKADEPHAPKHLDSIASPSPRLDTPVFDTAISILATSIPSHVNLLRVKGYASAGDGGAALYKKVAFEPSCGGNLQSADGGWWEIEEEIARPEMFGFMGTTIAAAAVDETTAATAMGNWGRRRGSLHLRLAPGKKYSYTNPYFLTGIRDSLIIDGHDAAFQNIRATVTGVSGNAANFQCLVFPSIFYNGGQNVWEALSPQLEYGPLVHTVPAGSTTITLLPGGSNADFIVGKRALIYGYAMQVAGFPITTLFFEYVTITGIDGLNLTIAEPLRFSYYSDFPVIVSSGTYLGPPRILSCSRGSNNFEETASMEFNGLRFMADSGWSERDGGTINRNGRPWIGSYKKAVLNHCTGEGGLYVMQGQHFTDNGSNFAGETEVDKFIELAQFEGVDYAAFSQGTGCRQLVFSDNSIIRKMNSIDALETVEIRDSVIAGYTRANKQILSGTFGTPTTKIKNSRIKSHNSLLAYRFSDPKVAAFDQASPTRLYMRTSLFIRSNLVRVMRPNSILYNAGGEAVFRCTAPAREDSDRTFFDGVMLCGSYMNGDTLYCPTFPDVEALGNELLGCDDVTWVPAATSTSNVLPLFAKRRDKYANEGKWVLSSNLRPEISTTAIRMALGYLVKATKLTIDVTRPYTGATATALLEVRLPDGAVLACVDLKTSGRRVMVAFGEARAISTHDALNELSSDPLFILQIRTSAAVAYGSSSDAAVWSVVLQGMQILE